MAYYNLIGYAYQNHFLEKITGLEPGFKYTFIVHNKPKNMDRSEHSMSEYSYCLNYVEPSSLQVIPINSEILPYNQDDPRRWKETEVATGFFIVDTCQQYQDVYSPHLPEYGIKISKEGILDNTYEEKIILKSNEIHLII